MRAPLAILGALLLASAASEEDDATGYSVWDDLACVGPTVRVLPFAVPSVDSCAAFCTSEPDCYVFNYGTVDSSCALKEECTAFRTVALNAVGVSLRSEWTGFRREAEEHGNRDPEEDALFRQFLLWKQMAEAETPADPEDGSG